MRGEALDHVCSDRAAGARQDEPRLHRPRGARGRAALGGGPGARAEGRRGRDPDRARARATSSSSTRSTGSAARSRRSCTRRSRTSGSTSSSGQGPAARTLTLDLPPFTLIGATTRTGLLTTPLRDRFGMTFRLEHYEPDELARSCGRSARILDVEIAGGGRGRDRVAARAARHAIANRILRRVRDVAEVRHQGAITTEIAARGARAARGRRARARADRPRAAARDRREVRRRSGRASRRWPSRSARSRTRSRTSTSRTCSSSASSSGRRAGGS